MSVKRAAVHVRVGQEVSHLVAVGVVVQRSEALVAEETGVAWSQLVIGGQPPGREGQHFKNVNLPEQLGGF